MKLKKSHVLAFALCASVTAMSFRPAATSEKGTEAKKVDNVKFGSSISLKGANAAFTPLVLVALAENSAAAVVVAGASLLGRCSSLAIVEDFKARSKYAVMRSLDTYNK